MCIFHEIVEKIPGISGIEYPVYLRQFPYITGTNTTEKKKNVGPGKRIAV
jgi:hypothetical protein